MATAALLVALCGCNLPATGQCEVLAYGPGPGTSRVLYGGNCVQAYLIARAGGGQVVQP